GAGSPPDGAVVGPGRREGGGDDGPGADDGFPPSGSLSSGRSGLFASDGRRVEADTGFDSSVASSAAATGRARGGSEAVPRIPVWPPHHDSVPAAAVASSQASTCTSPLRSVGPYGLARPTGVPPVDGSGVVHRPPPGPPAWRTVPPMASVLVVEDDQFVRSA